MAVLAAGLPNITGSFVTRQMSSLTTGNLASIITDGKLYTRSVEDNSKYLMLQHSNAPSNEIEGYKITFNASKSNSIYGDSSTVQSPAVINIFQVKI